MSLERADLIRQGSVEPTNSTTDSIIKAVVVPVAVSYPDPVYYSYTYVIPSMQFTALFQVGGVALKLFEHNVYPPWKLAILKGGVKATSSCIIILKNKYTKGKSISLGDIFMPFAKEPVVSVCKVGFDITSELINAPLFIIHDHHYTVYPIYPFSVIKSFMDFAQKPVCNFVGELSHNAAKCIFGKQKLSMEELERSIAFKTVWKTGHQVMEGELTNKLGVLGFYAGSVVPRSWGNDFIEEVATGNLEIEGLMLLPSNATYYAFGIVVMGGLVTFPHFANDYGN